MDKNIFELAKKLAALSPGESYAALRLIREHGYKPGERTSAVIDLARALISVWDGNASTLDQASAWREVWKYLGDAGLVKESSGRSRLGQVLDILGNYRRMSAGAKPLNQVQQSVLEVFDERKCWFMNLPEPGSSILDILKNNKETLKVSEHELGWGDKIHKQWMELFGKDMFDKWLKEVVDRGGLPTSVQYDPYNAKPCHPSHELYKTGDADAPEQIKDRNGEVVLDQCRHCRRAEAELLDGEPCAKAPANDRKWEGREFGKGCVVFVKPDYQTRQWPAVEMHVADVVETPTGEVIYRCEWCDQEGIDSGWCESKFLTRRLPANENYPPELYGEHMSSALRTLATVVEPARLDVVRRLLVLQDTCYGLANNAGWWTDLETGEDVRNWPKKHLDNWVSAKLMLIVTEVAEAMEGHRKGLKDDKLPHRGMLEVELADAVIRIMDLAGGLNMDVAGAIVEKLAYNMSREDHRIENRKAAGGKSV